MFLRNPNDSNYRLSNQITSMDFLLSAEAIILTRQLLESLHYDERQELGEQLLDALCDAAGIDIVELEIKDSQQYHRKRNGRTVMRRLGLYRVNKKTITIDNRTAVRGQIVASKTFIDTLLHEWLHHYDFLKLRLNSIHTKGFYLRLNDLKRKLEL